MAPCSGNGGGEDVDRREREGDGADRWPGPEGLNGPLFWREREGDGADRWPGAEGSVAGRGVRRRGRKSWEGRGNPIVELMDSVVGRRMLEQKLPHPLKTTPTKPSHEATQIGDGACEND